MPDYIKNTIALNVDTHQTITFETLRQADAELRLFFSRRPILTEVRVNPEEWARIAEQIDGAIAIHSFSPGWGIGRIDILPDPEVPKGTFKPVYYARD